MRNEDSYFDEIPDMKLPEEMTDLAHVIIERKAGHFRPEEFTDRYEDAVVELVRAKQAGMPAKAPEQPSRPSNVVSIMDALRKSIAAEGGAKRPARVRRAQKRRRKPPWRRDSRPSVFRSTAAVDARCPPDGWPNPNDQRRTRQARRIRF